MKKKLSLILAIFLVTTVLSSCLGGHDQSETDVPTDTLYQDATDETTDDYVSETDAPSKDVLVATAGEYVYSVLVSLDLSADERAEIRGVINELNLYYDIPIEFRIASKTNKETPEAKEILVGKVNRSDSEKADESIRGGEYVVNYNDETKRITVLGSSGELTVAAFKYLIETYFDADAKQIVIPKDLSYSYRGEYLLDRVRINGVNIDDYVIVVPSFEDLYSYYTALNISDYFKKMMGVDIRVVDDTASESDFEILIGDTNREEDDTAYDFQAGEYMMLDKGSKLVMRGDRFYVGAGFGDLISSYIDPDVSNGEAAINDIPTNEIVRIYTTPAKAENVILMIGDGMGYNHVKAALHSTIIEEFAAEFFPAIGSAITQSQSVINGDASYTDSAAAATALSTGCKTINGYIGKGPDGNDLKNVRELAHEFGAKTAVVTTDDITGATPAAFLAHNISRGNTEQLQAEIDALVAAGKIEYCEGLVDDEITTHTRNAINAIAYTSDPFFMMVEEARIDKRSHSNNLTSAVDKVMWYNDAIIYAACFVMINRDTALVVTADHETGGLTPTENGYAYTTGDHTNADVPIYAIGGGTQIFNNVRTDNTDIAKFIQKHYMSA